ncbi:FkbM family methyltransferase [Rhodovulum sp. 12E13]|uniref:FkbM family methyltransferase n=1 Tax=Rhodovulum sp. 12E13 TaxID=2203891 RepID=UPI000E154C5E|nr:FkbM family methyltransferase [Rhodovulum sp. 12E13]RDC73718.1 FkbM family methyltransferase [Rhodovulum sp. 12E13]
MTLGALLPTRRRSLTTRIANRIKRNRHRRAIVTLARLRGSDFAECATRYIREYGNRNVSVLFDSDTGRYVVKDGAEHRFTDPGRLTYYVDGLEARGDRLFEEYLLGAVPFEDGDSVVESGAYDGDFVLALERTGKRVHLTSFEPSPENALTARLNQSARPFLLSAETRQQALWQTTGESMAFHLKVDSADSSLIPIEGAAGTIEVETVRLDAAVPRRRHRLLKLEAEGAEPEVLAGAEGILDQFDYISADLGFERGVRQESTLPQVVNFLLPRGFEVVSVGLPRLVVLFRNCAGGRS